MQPAWLLRRPTNSHVFGQHAKALEALFPRAWRLEQSCQYALHKQLATQKVHFRSDESFVMPYGSCSQWCFLQLEAK